MKAEAEAGDATQCLLLNHKGVHAIASQHFKEAIRAFSGSLALLKAILGTYAYPDHVFGDARETSRDLCFRFADRGDYNQVPENDMDVDEKLFVYQNPIAAFCQKAAIEDCDFNSLARLSFALLYNLALAYQLFSLHEDDLSKKGARLRKALTFYKLAYTMMKDEAEHGIMETMAIVNNMGLVHNELKDGIKAKQCYEHLLSIMMYMLDAGEVESLQNFESFFQNIQAMVLQKQHTALAA